MSVTQRDHLLNRILDAAKEIVDEGNPDLETSFVGYLEQFGWKYGTASSLLSSNDLSAVWWRYEVLLLAPYADTSKRKFIC